MPAKPVRNGIFISYSHTDKKWVERLKIHLKPLERDHNVVVWNDTKLRSGDKWRTEISKALASAKVAILLVSADFLASDFIQSNELPPLLKASNNEGLSILPVIVGPCAFSFSPLSQYQTVNDPSRPLKAISEGQVDEEFFKLFQRVHGIFVKPTPQRNPAKTAAGKATKTAKLLSSAATKPAATKPAAAKPAAAKPAAAQVKATTLAITKRPKITKAAAMPKKPTEPLKSRSYSALLVKQNGDWGVLPVSQSEIGRVLSLTLHSTTPAQRSFLISLRQYENLSSIVFRDQTYPCTLKSLQSKTEGIQETWHLDATIGQLNPRTEYTLNRITPEMQAQIRARVLLLDEASSNDRALFMGIGSYLEIKESPFPVLYQLLGKQPAAFNRAAKLIATWYLQMSDTVEHIVKLNLSLKGQSMSVVFEGKRRAGHDEPPAVIRVEGTCDLSRPVATRTLRLGPLNRY